MKNDAESKRRSAKDEEEEDQAYRGERDRPNRPDDRRMKEDDRQSSLFSRYAQGEGSFYDRSGNHSAGGSDSQYYDSQRGGGSADSGERDRDGRGGDRDRDRHPSRQALAGRDDHRKQGFRGVGDTASGRLGKFITGNGSRNNGGRDDGELEEDILPEGDIVNRSQYARQQRDIRRDRDFDEEDERNSDGEREGDRESDRERDAKGEGEEVLHSDNESSGDEANIADKVEKIASPGPSVPEPSAAPVKRAMPSGAPPPRTGPSMPMGAPPRRARDALAEVESQQRTRRSIDDVLRAEAKPSEREKEKENSDEEDFDIKVRIPRLNIAMGILKNSFFVHLSIV